MDWLSHVLALIPVRGHLDIRCLYGAPWRLALDRADAGEMPYHVVVSGSAVLEDPAGGPPQRLGVGDILLLTDGSAHVLHDGSGVPAVPAQERKTRNLTISENAGTGERLDMLCGRFVLALPHDRLLRDYLPARLVVRGADNSASAAHAGTGEQLSGLVSMMRTESPIETLGGRAMLNALSTALFTLTLRLASEAKKAPIGLLAVAEHPRLAAALTALIQEPGRAWTLPELARLSKMSRATLARHFQESWGARLATS